MAIDMREFWRSNHYSHPPITDDMIATAELQLGVRLPAEFLELLEIQNGGYTKGFAFPMSQPTSWAEDHIPLSHLAGIITDPKHKTAQNVLQTEYMTKEWGLPPKQVLLSGSGHFWITLDYRNGVVPSVAWIDVDCEEDIQVAPTFAAFLAGLVPDSNYDGE